MKKFNSYEEMPKEVQILVDRFYENNDMIHMHKVMELGYVVEMDVLCNEIEYIGVNETAEEIFSGLKYTTQFINMNWRIKVNAAGMNMAVGVSGLINLIGIDLANRLFDRACKGNGDKTVCKLRRGLKVSFYTK